MTPNERKEKVESLIKENRKNKSILDTLIMEMTVIDEAIILLQDSCPDHNWTKDSECQTCKWESPY